jgi:hypothetical protein
MMKQGPRSLAIAVTVGVAALATLIILARTGTFRAEVWERDTPLIHPIAVTSVQNGSLTLADGRTLRPAGISRPDTVSPDNFDLALRVMCDQGVLVLRDLGDGTAFLLAEPRFYNWCGTRGYKGNPWARWAGSYLQAPVSELLIQSAYAQPALDQAGLTPRERWRLEGAEHLDAIAESPRRVSEELAAFEFNGIERNLSEYETLLEMLWKPPPP